MIIGICGKKRSGKDTIGKFIAASYGYRLDSFAAPIRSFTCELLGISPSVLELVKEHPMSVIDGKSPRDLMQQLGTEFMRGNYGQDVWVRSLVGRIKDNTVVTDIRFDNEAKAIKDLGGKVFHVVRDLKDSKDTHASEKGIDPNLVDIKVLNNSTLEALYKRVSHIMSELEWTITGVH